MHSLLGPEIGAQAGQFQEMTGNVELAQGFRRQFGGLFEGYARQDMDLMNASTMVQPFMSAWMKGNAKVTVNGQTDNCWSARCIWSTKTWLSV